MQLASNLLDWADTDAQKRAITAVLADPNQSVRAAARALGLNQETVRRTVLRVAAKAARDGHAPGFFDSGTPAGYLMGKVTIQRGGDGQVERTWERQSPDDEARQEAILAAFEAMKVDLPRVEPIFPPLIEDEGEQLLNLFTISDYHMGMLAWDKEAGADWDLSIAESMLYRAFERLIRGAPDAKVAVINQLGDFLHTDGLKALTPEHGNLLDADSRFPKMVSAAVRVLRRVVDMALETHDQVHVVMAEGNHDVASSIWLRELFSTIYENEPRVTVDKSPLPYYVYQHGQTMLGFHHGHLSKNESLPALFAAKFRSIWGLTTRAYIHTGHRHNEKTMEFPGAKVIQHPTLAAADAYAARSGYVSERQMSRITYHDVNGKVGEEIVTPEMLSVVGR